MALSGKLYPEAYPFSPMLLLAYSPFTLIPGRNTLQYWPSAYRSKQDVPVSGICGRVLTAGKTHFKIILWESVLNRTRIPDVFLYNVLTE